MTDQKYKVLSGTVNEGERYETVFTAKVALELALDDDINFFISANNEEYYPFDDVIIETETIDGLQQKLALQLKHGEKILTIKSLTGKSGEFSVQKYMEGMKKLKHSLPSLQEIDKFKWILFTNRKFNYEKGARFQIENENLVVEMAPCECEAVLENCFRKGLSYKFNTSKASTECDEFFEKFFFYSNQSNVNQIENELSKRFQQKFNCGENIFLKYLKFISDWNNKKGKREKLNKAWIKQLIAVLLLSPYVIPLSINSIINEKSNILLKCINNFNITVFENRNWERATQFWDVKKQLEEIEIQKINEMKNKFSLISTHIRSIDDLTELESSKILWLLDRCPLIIKYKENIIKVIDLCENKKFIVVYDTSLYKHLRIFDDKKLVFQNLSDLRKYPLCYEELTKNFRCSLQGKLEITLERLINGLEELQKNITTNNLLLFLNDKLILGEEKDLKIYIPRKLSRQVVDEKFLESCSEDTIVVIDCVNESGRYNSHFEIKDIESLLSFESDKKIFSRQTELLENNMKTVYVSKNRCNRKKLEELYKQIEDKTGKQKQFHLFRLFESNLEWISSLAPIEALREFVNNNYFMNEEELYNNESDDTNLIILCGEAGLGKTTLMQKFRKTAFSTLWSILLNPKDHLGHLKNIKGDIFKFEQYILNEVGKDYRNFDLKMFEILLKTGRVNYIWDGLDEISEESLPLILEVIETLSKRGLKQCLTSRNNLRENLENRFYVFAKTVKEFDEQEQKCYIKERLHCGQTELEELFRKISSQINFFKYSEVLSIPLQIYMFTELLLRDKEKYNSLLDNIFSLTDLYQHFIDVKFNIYYEDKENQKTDNEFAVKRRNEDKKHRISQYQLAALKLYFPDRRFNDNTDFVTFLKKIKIKDEYGIITSVSSDGVVNFLHNSYGEYFAALYFSRNYEKIPDLHFLFEERNKNIRFMFDLILAKGCPTHIATLCQNVDLLKSYKSDLLKTEVDKGGRSPLHLACSWGGTYFPLKVEELVERSWLRKKPIYSVHSSGKFACKESLDYKHLLEYLLEYCNHNQKDLVYKLTALSYADETYNLYALSNLLENYVGPVKNLKCFQNIHLLLCYSAAFDFSNIFDHVKKIPHITSLNSNNSLLNLAATYGSFSCCQKILSKSKSSRNCTNLNISLIRACENGHIDVVKLLINTGAEVSTSDKNGETTLHKSCMQGSVDVANLLIKGGVNINIADMEGRTPLYAACVKGYVAIANLLIEEGADINITDIEGKTPLYAACVKGHVDLASLLIKKGADINVTSIYQRTPLYGVCWRGNFALIDLLFQQGANVTSSLHEACSKIYVDVANLLIKEGADVNIVDVLGRTPLHSACTGGYIDVINFFVKEGADINVADKYGRTSLHEAGWLGRVNVAKLLIQEGAVVDVVDINGRTPLYEACRWGQVDVTKLLIEEGADVNITDNYGRTPLHVICQRGRLALADLLIERGAKVNVIDRAGITPLYEACMWGRVDVVKLLIDRGADVHLVDKFGRSSLQIASSNGHVAVVDLLVEAGAK